MHQLTVVFIVYILVIIGFVIHSNQRTKNLSDYMLGGRHLSGAVAALGAGASDMSSWLILALPGAVMLHGLNQIWLPIGLSIGQYLNWQLISRRLRVYTEIANDSITIPAYLENRFHDTTKILRLVTALVILLFFTFYTASGFVSGGLLFQSTFHVSYVTGLWITAAIVIAYTCIGGFLAIAWIDFFQGTLMFFALIIVPLVTLHSMGGLDSTMRIIGDHSSAAYLDAFHGVTLISILSLLSWGLGYFGQPHIIVRFMAMSRASESPKAQFICMTWMNIALYGAVFTGLFGMAFFASNPLMDTETGFIHLSTMLFNPWIAGILLAAVLSATMSTSSAQLLSSSSAVVEDVYHRFLRPSAKSQELLWVSRLGVILIAIVSLFLAHDPKSSILNLVSYAWAGLGGAFGPVILISLFWRRMNLAGALAGIVSGAFVVIIWPHLHALGGIFKLYELMPAFLLSCVAIVVSSLVTQKPSNAVDREFDESMAMLKRSRSL